MKRIIYTLLYENGQFIQNLSARTLPAGPAELYLDMTGLAQGVYIIRIQGTAGLEKIERIVKL